MSLNRKYYENRNSKLGSSQSLNPVSRTNLASREIQTYEMLCKLSDNNSNIKNSIFLDLGAGDQFLKSTIESLESKYIPLDIGDVDFNKQVLPLDDSSVDILFSLAVIEHISDIDHFMNECKRVLRPGGNIYLSTPNFRYCFRTFYNDPTHVRPFTDVSLKELVAYYEFENVNIFPGARCKSEWFYRGKYKFAKCAYLPFKGDNKWAPSILCGRATSIICIARKPKC